MFCNKCGKERGEAKKFCGKCGAEYVTNSMTFEQNISVKEKRQKTKVGKFFSILGAIVAFLIIGSLVLFKIFATSYNAVEGDAINTNNEALETLSSGDTETAIEQLESASNSATFDSNKLLTLQNLGYAHVTAGNSDKALVVFEEALHLTEDGSVDSLLMKAEIALLEGRYEEAEEYYVSVTSENPKNFSANNGLNLLYLDLEEEAPEMTNYTKALVHAKIAHESSDQFSEDITAQNLGIAYYFNEDYPNAIAQFNTQSPETNNYIAYWIGLAHASSENHERGTYFLKKAVESGMEIPQEVIEYLQ